MSFRMFKSKYIACTKKLALVCGARDLVGEKSERKIPLQANIKVNIESLK
jgi:hypothetical protein